LQTGQLELRGLGKNVSEKNRSPREKNDRRKNTTEEEESKKNWWTRDKRGAWLKKEERLFTNATRSKGKRRKTQGERTSATAITPLAEPKHRSRKTEKEEDRKKGVNHDGDLLKQRPLMR